MLKVYWCVQRCKICTKLISTTPATLSSSPWGARPGKESAPHNENNLGVIVWERAPPKQSFPGKHSTEHSRQPVRRTSPGDIHTDTHRNETRRHAWETIKRTVMASTQEDNLGTPSSGHSCATIKRTSLRKKQMDIHSQRNKNLFGKQLSGRPCVPIKRTISGKNQAFIHGQQLRAQP